MLIRTYFLRPLSYQELLIEAEKLLISAQLFRQFKDYYGMVPMLQDDRFLMRRSIHLWRSFGVVAVTIK